MHSLASHVSCYGSTELLNMGMNSLASLLNVVMVLLSKQWNYRGKKQNKETDVDSTIEQDTYDNKMNSYADFNDIEYQVNWDTDG